MDWKKIATRMAVTFVEAFLGTLVVIPAGQWAASSAEMATVAGVAAVASLAYNYSKQYLARLEDDGPAMEDTEGSED